MLLLRGVVLALDVPDELQLPAPVPLQEGAHLAQIVGVVLAVERLLQVRGLCGLWGDWGWEGAGPGTLSSRMGRGYYIHNTHTHTYQCGLEPRGVPCQLLPRPLLLLILWLPFLLTCRLRPCLCCCRWG